MLTVEHISILVWLKSRQQILLLKEEVPYGLGLGISSPTKPLTLALIHTCNFRCFMGFNRPSPATAASLRLQNQSLCLSSSKALLAPPTPLAVYLEYQFEDGSWLLTSLLCRRTGFPTSNHPISTPELRVH